MFGQKFRKEVGIQAADVLKSIGRGKLRSNSKIKCGCSERKIEVEQQRILLGLLREQDGKVARDRADTGAALGTGKYQ